MQCSANLTVMIKTARLAGRSLAKDFREVENLQVSSKSAGDFVSRADIAAENIIRKELTEARPTYGWIGEESGETKGKIPQDAGLSTHWTARQIFCTGCHIGLCRLLWNIVVKLLPELCLTSQRRNVCG